jgi:hypothetical protein
MCGGVAKRGGEGWIAERGGAARSSFGVIIDFGA